MNFLDAVAEIVAVHNGVRHNAGSTHDGATRYLAGNLFDQFASYPVDVRGRILKSSHQGEALLKVKIPL
jgi:hypothetical protein